MEIGRPEPDSGGVAGCCGVCVCGGVLREGGRAGSRRHQEALNCIQDGGGEGQAPGLSGAESVRVGANWSSVCVSEPLFSRKERRPQVRGVGERKSGFGPEIGS